MFSILPVRKIIKVVFLKRGVTKRDRALISLTEDLDKNNVIEQRLWQIYFVFFILLLTCFIHFLTFYFNISKKYDNIRVFKSSEEANKSSPINGSDESLPICFVKVQKLGNVFINKTVTEISETDYAAVQRGGYYTPEDCRSRHKVALLVPYRMMHRGYEPIAARLFQELFKGFVDFSGAKYWGSWHINLKRATVYEICISFRNRKENLATFLFNIHPFLMNQKLEYRIFIIEQEGTELFNKGRVFNAGFKEVKKFGSWKCVVLHDVDLLPLDGRILYTCPMWPRHMCATVKEVTNPTFRSRFGGVSAMTLQHFEKVNGFSNMYWGWGGEDTDLFMRIRSCGLPVVGYNRKIATYTSLNHSKQELNYARYSLLKTALRRLYTDGLSSLKYTVESVTLHHLYTHILVDINPPQEYNDFIA